MFYVRSNVFPGVTHGEGDFEIGYVDANIGSAKLLLTHEAGTRIDLAAGRESCPPVRSTSSFKSPGFDSKKSCTLFRTLVLIVVVSLGNACFAAENVCSVQKLNFNKPWDKQWIAAKVRDNPIEWIAINSTKPHRTRDVTSIVAHTQNQWAEDHINDDMKIAEECLLQNFQAVSGIDCGTADYISTHRWKYAIVEAPEKSEPYIDSNQCIAATSDWCSASRIEDVWLSAMQLAEKLRNQ